MDTLTANNVKIVGGLYYGHISSSFIYHPHPNYYPAFEFHGQKGDLVTISVSSYDGDAMAWLLSGSFKTLARNDDANDGTLDSRIHAVLPGNINPNITKYYIAFRDYYLEQANFTVRLSKEFVWPFLYPIRTDRPRREK